ncbi:hypothetical protein WA026_014978 [Henosepilachna vigintioctopunctata]|uniref:Choline transporter-like protein n=1 Tax=Henosepilachna vigintioctopunctata TaxID=420089 RepID=A0AAW1U9Q5_9CUCU
MNRCFKVEEIDDEKEVVNLFDLLIDQQVIRDLRASIGYIFGMAFIALGLCFLMLLLFKYFIGGTIRAIIISTMLFTIALTIHLWISKRKHRTGTKWILLIVSIVITVGVFLSWKKLNFVTKVFRETTNAVFAMPFLMLLPIWVFLIDIVLLALLLFLMVMYYSCGVLTHIYGEYYTYYPTGLMVFTVLYTLLFYLYLSAFLHGCQQVIVAGAISTWYFSREKDNILGSPILDSLRNLRKYHLGSVALGSFIVTLMKIIRLIVKGLLKKRAFICFRILIDCCIDLMEEFVHYASEQAYIVVAMHGQPFLKSGKRATKLLIENALSTLSVNTVGDFVLWMSKVLVGIGTMICGEILDDGTIPFFGVTIFIGGLLGVILAHSVFRNFEICVDTIFLCYCEDTYVHDGIEHPYYATVGLVAVVEEAKGVIEEQKMYDSIKTEPVPQTFV